MGSITVCISVPATLAPWLKAARAVAAGEILFSTVALSAFAVAAAAIVLALEKAPATSTCGIVFTSTRWWPHFQNALTALRAEQQAAPADDFEDNPPSAVCFTLVELDCIFHGGSIAGPWGQWAVLGRGLTAEPEGEVGGASSEGEPADEQTPEQDHQVSQATPWAPLDAAVFLQAAGVDSSVFPSAATQQELAEQAARRAVSGPREVDPFGQVSAARKEERATASDAVQPKRRPRGSVPIAPRSVTAAPVQEQTAPGGLASATRKRSLTEPELNAGQMMLAQARREPQHPRSQGDATVEETTAEFGMMEASSDEINRTMVAMRRNPAFFAASLAKRDSAPSSCASGSGSADGVAQTGSAFLMRNLNQTKTERNKVRSRDEGKDHEEGEDAGGQGKGRKAASNFNKRQREQSKGAGKGREKGKDKERGEGSSGQHNGRAPRR